jgi:hypothetical protein
MEMNHKERTEQWLVGHLLQYPSFSLKKLTQYFSRSDDGDRIQLRPFNIQKREWQEEDIVMKQRERERE